MKLFKIVLSIRILLNTLLGMVHIFAPEVVLKVAGMATVVPIGWVRYAGLQVLLITLVYLPAVIRPEENRGSALYACLISIPLVILFLVEGWFWFAVYDAIFVVILTSIYRKESMAAIMKHP